MTGPNKPDHAQLEKRLEGIRQILMAHHAAGSLLPNAVKGSEREALLREFLAKVFPLPFRFGTGVVVDSTGAASGQLDIVSEFPFFPSFPTPGAADRLYLAESVSFVIEVKSDLASQWTQVEEKAEKVIPLRRIWRSHLKYGPEGALEMNDNSESRIPFVAVGFAGYQGIETLERRLLDTPEEKRPDAALVLESGAYVSLLTKTRAVGPHGLFAFCADAAYFATNVLTAHPDFGRYFAPEK